MTFGVYDTFANPQGCRRIIPFGVYDTFANPQGCRRIIREAL